MRAAAAIDAGHFADEIVAVPTAKGDVTVDETPRRDTTLEVLATLKPVVAGGSVVTAGNSSPLNDGASAIVVASAAAVERYGLTPRARIVTGTSAGIAPEIMGLGPVPATEKALAPQRPGARRDRRRRAERGVRDPVARRHPPPRSRPGARQRRRRRHRARPPARLERLAARRHAARPHGARGRPLRPRDDVRRRRPGHRADRGAGLSERRAGRTTTALRVERLPDRVVATLDGPAVRNAIGQATIDALHDLCAELEAEPRILILTGAGGVFASGADIAELRDRRADDARAGINAHAFIRIHELPMPVIAAIDGFALGGGAELAYAADIRIASPDARIGNPETGLGIIAAAGRHLAPQGDRRRRPRDRAAADRARAGCGRGARGRAGVVAPRRRPAARRRPRDRRPDRRQRPARHAARRSGCSPLRAMRTPPSTSRRRPSCSRAPRRSGG